MSEVTPANHCHVAVCGASDPVHAVTSALASSTLRNLDVPIVACEPPQNGSDKRPFLEALRGCRVCVLAADGAAGWSLELRQLCLLAVRLTGIAPIIAVVGGDAAAIAAGWREMATLLGLPPSAAVIVDHSGKPDDLAEKVAAELASASAPLASAGFARLAIASPKSPDSPTRSVIGTTLSGTFEPGLKVVLLPSAQAASVISCTPAGEPGSVTVELDGDVVIGTDTVLATGDRRPEQADQVVAHMVWFGRKPMLPGRTYNVRIAGQTSTAQIGALKHKVDPVSLNPIAARRLEQGSVGLCNVSFSDSLVFDIEGAIGQPQLPTRRFVLEDRVDGGVVGIGDIVFMLRRATNIHWQALAVDKAARATLKQQRPGCLWFTGLSGSGKSTVASLLEKRLNAMGRHTYTLDGDNVRHGLNRDLGFTDTDRVENIRRVGEVSKLMVDAGLLVMVSFISPFRAERRMARSLFPTGEFLEIFVDTPIGVCEQRDPKGLYKKARSGQLKNFTGIDSPYEPPEQAEIHLPGGDASPEDLVERVLADLMRRGMV